MVGPSRVTIQERISADVLYDLGQDGMKMRRVGTRKIYIHHQCHCHTLSSVETNSISNAALRWS